MANWIQKAIKSPGALRKQTGTKKGKNISTKKLNALARKKGISSTTKRRIALAKTLKKLRKRKRK
jgi:hypothetical protein